MAVAYVMWGAAGFRRFATYRQAMLAAVFTNTMFGFLRSAILLAVAITAALGPSATNAVIALAAVYTPRTARMLRASVLVVREMEYVQAVYAAGASHLVLRFAGDHARHMELVAGLRGKLGR